jgi:uncharacterized alkaline shock family protein YloU
MKQAEKKSQKKAPESAVVSCEKGTELGVIKIHENVISSIVRKAALSIPGITRLAGSSFVDNIAEIVGSRKMHDRAIAINMEDDKVSIEIKVNIQFGFKVPELASAVQSAVVEQVEGVTGMTVTGVNVVVQEIEEEVVEEPQPEEASEE